MGESAPAPRVLVAPDSFKGTFSAELVADAIARGCESVGVAADRCPVADGGEGTADALLRVRGGRRIAAPCHDPLGRPIEGEIGLLGEGREAVVEVACASGLALLGRQERDPWSATSRGTGELIAAAATHGAGKVLVAAGGSATVDGGRGAIEALRESPALGELSLVVLCDVESPWECCAALYGPQKGAEEALVRRLSRRLAKLAAALPRDPRGVPMGGAAGGLAGGLWAAFGAELLPGAAFVLEALGVERRLVGAAAAITGEGRLDAQSSMGKAVGELARRALAAGVPLHAIVGSDGRQAGTMLAGLRSVVEAGTLDSIQEAARRIALTFEGGSALTFESGPA